MATATSTATPTDWRQEWFEFEGTTYLDTARHGAMPKVAIRATHAAIEWKKFPNQMPDSSNFELPRRVRESVAKLIGARPEDIAVTSGASAGMSSVAYGLAWKPGDEIITGAGEFPLQYTTWKPMEEREGITLKIVEPQERFFTADDFISALTPKTRLVSVSLVRFDDGSLLDAAKLARACRAQETLFLLDLSQACGAMPLDVGELGADFIVCCGYKWLLGPYGTGFFWARREATEKLRPGPFYWMAIQGMKNFSALNFSDPHPESGSKRWDAAETASHFNLAGMAAALELILRVGPAAIEEHCRGLINMMYERLPKDRCVPASPLEAVRRGVYGCFAARSPEKTKVLYDKIIAENISLSFREGKIRVSPYLYNTERDIDKLISVITA